MAVRERQTAYDIESVRALSSVLRPSALESWFAELGKDYDDTVPPHSRVVRGPDTRRIGVAALGVTENYYQTVSLHYLHDGDTRRTTVRGRRFITNRFPPRQYIERDFLGEDGSGAPPQWRRQNVSTQDLIVPGTHISASFCPAIATVEAPEPLSAAAAEEALLRLGGILLTGAGLGQQGTLFEGDGREIVASWS